MLFNSLEFIFIFLPITFVIYFGLNYKGYYYLSRYFLVASSLFFYSWWNIIYLPLIVLSMMFNFWLGNLLKQNSFNFLSKKTLLTIGVSLNLCLLGYFKYYDFFIENINNLLSTNFQLLHLALPLAISFFTFQQIAYLVDSYRAETKEYDFIRYAVFVTFFPQLIAGPIVHHKEMMPQFADEKNSKIKPENIVRGLYIFSIGLFKKVVIADTFATYANQGFDVAKLLSFYESWATSLSYTLQLYFDFSGYTDMAIGIALLFNIILPFNFNSPYKALNIQDFWRRWHMTLSRFLRDYIYIPLGGNRKGGFNTYFNLMATFILGGLWHGAAWTFMLWGFLHGFAISIHRLWTKLGIKMWRWLAWLITFMFINFTWVFFRAEHWDDVEKIIKGMLGIQKGNQFNFSVIFLEKISAFFNYPLIEYLPYSIRNSRVDELALLFCFICMVFVLTLKNNNRFLIREKLSYNRIIIASLAFSLSVVLSITSSTEIFLYFNF